MTNRSSFSRADAAPGADPDPDALAEADRALASGDTAQARTLLEETLRDFPQSARLHTLVGICCRHEGDEAGALRHLQKALQIEPDGLEALLALGQLAAAGGRHEEAAGYFDRALHAHPKNPKAWAGSGWFCRFTDRIETARTAFQQALRLDPNYPDARAGLEGGRISEPRHRSVVAIIPARGGSQRIPGKNLVAIDGKPLLQYTIEHAVRAHRVDRVYVSTEDPAIAEVATGCGVEVAWRSESLAGDTATSESALADCLAHIRRSGIEPGLIVFLQCTSPVRADDDIDRAIEMLETTQADSLLSGCRNTRFLWSSGQQGEFHSLNYDYQQRPREQDFEPQFQENGSIYLFKPWVLDTLGNRLGGKIALYEMDYWSSFQIDSPDDLELLSWVLPQRSRTGGRASWDRIELLVLDFDGVLTDNRVWMTQDGQESVVCDRSDGLGIASLRAHGVDVVVLSTETNPVVGARCKKLGIACLQGVQDKETALHRLAREHKLGLSRVAYLGNDVNDLGCLREAGLGVAVADAHRAVLDVADRVLERSGGHGAVRELCDWILAENRNSGDTNGAFGHDR